MLHQIFAQYYTLIISMVGSCIIGALAGILGVFAFLRKQSLLGDTISHASLPGIVIALLLSAGKNPAILLMGGAITGALGTLLALTINRTTTLHKDTILGVILSTFFGLGLLLISFLQKASYADQTIINKFLFGNPSLMLREDLTIIFWIAVMVIALMFLCWKEFTLLTFDAAYAQSIGYSTSYLELLSTLLLVITIVLGLQKVGVILMSALLIAPAAAARQWTHSIKTMALVSACIGAISTLMGSYFSMVSQLASGPSIVVLLSGVVFCSLLIAPKRGILTAYIKRGS